MTDPTPFPADQRVLVLTAHPDDVDFGAAGTVARLVGAGCTVAYCIATDGDAGGFDPALDRSQIPAIRQAEQRAAAKVLGVDEVSFLGRPDGALVADLDLRRDLTRHIRAFRPDLVITSSPERYYERMPASHPDHRAVGDAALSAVYPDARNPFAFPELLEEGLEAHSVLEVWLMGHPGADYGVDITEVLEQKLAAIAAHVSQLPDPDRVDGFVREWTSGEAERLGLGDGHHAEVFKAIRLF